MHLRPTATTIQLEGITIHHQLVLSVAVASNQTPVGDINIREDCIALHCKGGTDQRDLAAVIRAIVQNQQGGRRAIRNPRVIEYQFLCTALQVLQVNRARCSRLRMLGQPTSRQNLLMQRPLLQRLEVNSNTATATTAVGGITARAATISLDPRPIPKTQRFHLQQKGATTTRTVVNSVLTVGTNGAIQLQHIGYNAERAATSREIVAYITAASTKILRLTKIAIRRVSGPRLITTALATVTTTCV